MDTIACTSPFKWATYKTYKNNVPFSMHCDLPKLFHLYQSAHATNKVNTLSLPKKISS